MTQLITKTRYYHCCYAVAALLICFVSQSSFCQADEKDKNEDSKKVVTRKLENKSISSLGVNIIPPKGDLPKDTTSQNREVVVPHVWGLSRPWMETSVEWEASNLHHQPLYFEEINTERHGYRAYLIQPLVSAGNFYGTIPILPYKMGVHLPWEKQYTLGYYRPGNAVPLKHNRLPLSWRGALFQAGATVGLIAIIP